MKTLTALFTAAALTLGANAAFAKDVQPDEVVKLVNAKTIKSLDELKGLFETIVKTVGEQGHQNQILAEKVQHGFGNTAASLQAVANELDRIRDRLAPGRS